MSTPDHQADTLATILDLSRMVCSSLDLDVVFERILVALQNLSGADAVSIMLLDDRGAQLRIVAARGVPYTQFESQSFGLGEGIAGWVAAHNLPIHTADVSDDPRFVPMYLPAGSTLFSLPLSVRGRTLGVLNLASLGRGELFSAETVQMVEIFASHAAIAIDNAAAATSLRYAATRERVVRLVHQAPRQAGATLASSAILADLASSLEMAACIIYMPSGEAGYTGFAAFPEGVQPLSPWQPEAPGATLISNSGPEGCELQARIELWEGQAGWLVVMSGRGRHFWRRAERELASFVADQLALLLANQHLIEQEQQSRELSRTLSQLAAACNAMVGEESLLDFILEQLARFIAYDSSGVFLFHDSHYAHMVAGRGFQATVRGLVIYLGPGALAWEVCETRQALYVPDVQLRPEWQKSPDSHMIRAWIAAPLVVNDRVIGIMSIDKWKPDAFGESDVQVAKLFADHVSVAINNQRLLRDAQTRASQLQLLHRISMRLSAFREAGSLLDEVARLLHATFGYYQVLVGIVEGDEIVLQAAYGAVNQRSELYFIQRYNTSHGITGWVARTGETCLVNNVATSSLYAAHPQLEKVAAELVVPIKGSGPVLGVIAIESDQIGAFSQHDIYLAETIAGQTALALEHMRRDEELRRTEERLAHGERLRTLGELASGIAHDFNNLLASILGHAQLLLGESPPVHFYEELRLIERAALDGAASIRRLQSFAQTSRVLPSESVDLNEIVTESLAITRPRWRDGSQSRGAEIAVVHLPGQIRPFAGDAPALRDLVTNLVLNALDAMPWGGTLRLRTAALPAESSPLNQETALLEVSDTGVGMSPEVREHIFDPFYTTKGPYGTGMGLAMVYGVVQRHMGRISVVSKPGSGTTFSVYLPAREATAAASPPPRSGQPVVPRRILVVDDEDAVRRVLVRQMSRLGHAVTEASSGEEALQALAAEQFDLLCTDLGMPGMSGWELITRARGLDRALRTILVTGWGEQISVEEARSQGADALIAKPFDAARIRQVIAELSGEGAGVPSPRILARP